MLNFRSKIHSKQKLTVFNKVQLVCNFFPSVVNNSFVLIFFFQFFVKTWKYSNCLRKLFIFLQKQSCPSFVCLFFFFLFICLTAYFTSKWVQRDKFLFTMWFHNFSYIIFDQNTSLSEWFICEWWNMFKNVGFLWWRVLDMKNFSYLELSNN